MSKEAKGIRGLYRDKYGKVKLKLLLEVIWNYSKYEGNYINRKAEDNEEKKEHEEYLKIKREHQIYKGKLYGQYGYEFRK